MAQRVQTLFLAVAEMLFLLTVFFPLALFYSDNIEYNYTYRLYIYGIRNMVPGTENLFSSFATIPLILLLAASLFFTVWSIANYKNRLFQIKINKINLLTTIFLIVGIFFYYPGLIERTIHVPSEFGTVAYLPLASLLLIIVANRFIQKDEKLVRSADRLR